MDYKKSYLLLRFGMLGGVILSFIGLALSSMDSVSANHLGNVFAVLGAVGIFGGLIQARAFYKCPHCGRRIKMRGVMPDYCLGCGRKLDTKIR